MTSQNCSQPFIICLRLGFMVLMILGVGKGWHWIKDGFSIQRTAFPLAPIQESLVDEETRAALQQTYDYLGRGHQCYAFQSADGRYVLKLPRADRYRLPFWLKTCTFPFLDSYREALQKDKQSRKEFLLNSFQIAFTELKEKTALLYLHLNRTDQLQTHLWVYDRLGRAYVLNLDQQAFILQKKVPLMMPLFQEALRQRDYVKAQQILTSFLDFIALRSRKGIFNKDPSFLRNFGYTDQGIQIDIGSFYRKEGEKIDAFLQTVGHVQEWLSQEDPLMARWFHEQVDTLAQSLNLSDDSDRFL